MKSTRNTTAALLAGAMIAATAGTIRADLVASWNFDETTGIIAVDTSGSAMSHDAAWQNAGGAGLTWDAAGQVGGCAILAGTNNSYEFLADSTSLDGATSFTIGGWVQWNGAGGYKGIATAQPMELTIDGAANSTNAYCAIAFNTDHKIDNRVNNNNGSTIPTAISS